MMTLGNKLSKLRKENNLTQEQLAEPLLWDCWYLAPLL